MRRLVAILALLPCGACADALSDIVGPVVPMNSGPWAAYDLAVKGDVDAIVNYSMNYVPLTGSALPGTYTLNNVIPITLTGTTAPGVNPGDTILVAWNGPDGAANTRLIMGVASVSGNVITTTNSSGLSNTVWNSSPLSGLTVYTCARCVVDITDPTYGTGLLVYSCGHWGLCGQNGGASWNFYDPALAIYRVYLRTGDPAYLTAFRNFTDTWWEWALQSGAPQGLNPPRWYSLVSQYVRALDLGGAQGTARLAALYGEVYSLNFLSNVGPCRLDGQDNREPGYCLIWAAVGARADSDATRHTNYCSMVTTLVNDALSVQDASGRWNEKNGPFSYAMPGESPWRVFALNQGLARAYDVLNDTTAAGCNNTTLAASVLSALVASGNWVYSSGYDPTGRQIYYDADHPNDGLNATGLVNHGGTCTVTSGSTSFTCSGGVTLQTDFNCNGTDYIGFENSSGSTWTAKLQSCASQTQGTFTSAWGGAEQTTKNYMGNVSAGSYTSINFDSPQIARSLPASSTCHNSASFCVPFGSGLQSGYTNRIGNFDAIWIMGWLYKTTGNATWKTRGDEIFSAAYGGPADGPGGSMPCSGPGCDGYEADYGNVLPGCFGGMVPPPCNRFTNYAGPMNVYAFLGKTVGQVAGIGGADNYLGWRLGGFVPTITTSCPLPNGTQAAAYSYTLAASGDTPITWSITSGSLPTGLTLNSSTGNISGTPTVPGLATFAFQATNAIGSAPNGPLNCNLTVDSSTSGHTGSRTGGGARINNGRVH